MIILVIILATIKTFFFLRIFKNLSYIVTMLTHVIYDLRIFLSFYILLLFMFSLIFGVLGLNNYETPGALKTYIDSLPEDYENETGEMMPGQEYMAINILVSHFLFVYRASLGDFDFDSSIYLSDGE